MGFYLFFFGFMGFYTFFLGFLFGQLELLRWCRRPFLVDVVALHHLPKIGAVVEHLHLLSSIQVCLHILIYTWEVQVNLAVLPLRSHWNKIHLDESPKSAIFHLLAHLLLRHPGLNPGDEHRVGNAFWDWGLVDGRHDCFCLFLFVCFGLFRLFRLFRLFICLIRLVVRWLLSLYNIF